MSDANKAKIKPNRVFSMVWLIPFITLIIGAWMLMDNIKAKGPEITLLMPNADGIEVNKTVVKVLSVDVGRVTKIKLNKERNGVEVKIQLSADTKTLLKENTKFWVVKPRIDQGGVQGLGTLLSGAYIEFSPGTTGEETDTFNVLANPPITATNQQGLRIQLDGPPNKLIPVGNPVLFNDIIVGRIEQATFDSKTKKTHYQIFIDKPHDTLVHSNIRFWVTSGIDIKASPEGFKVRSGALPTLLGGGISFAAKPGTPRGNNVPQNTHFTLFPDFDQVQQSPSDRAIYYVVMFDQSIRGLAVDSPVEYKGIRIGAVEQVPFYEKNHSLTILQDKLIPALIRIDPEHLEINADTQEKSYWENDFNRAINKGLVAKLQSNSLIMGGLYVDLSMNPTPVHRTQNQYASFTVIPSVSSGLSQIQDQLSALLEKLNKLPIESSIKELNATLKEVRTLTTSLNKVASSKETANMPKELNATLQEVRKTLQGISPDSPIYGEVQNTLKSLNSTLKQIEPTVRTLNEQPNALIFNRSKKDPIPKGSQ